MDAIPSLHAQIERANRELADDPERLLRWALALGRKAVVSTSFGPYSAVMLHLATRVDPDIPVLWVDTGYATASTYRFADALTRQLGLRLHVAQPRRSRAHREALEGPPPGLADPRHAAFTQEVKLEPFDRAIAELGAGTWISGIRAEETAHRRSLQPAMLDANGVLKLAPLLAWTTRDLHRYVASHGLPNHFDYHDPTKVEDKRECGLHLATRVASR